ncbi:unnamed protein product [Symbiodinium natans]|uniref:Uncharacterized protein n=1 Tax=Symbiodinium natans TaxID=878477 RepID=A0A812IBD3_9DINO|nr:unnamed protein product [Symbiodinium natans]
MLSKNAVYESHASKHDFAGRRLRENVADLFLSGSVSAKRARSLYADSQQHDPRESAELAQVADSSHAHRDLLRKLKKDKKWPGVFCTKVPLWNRKTCAAETGPIEIMLPHELVSCIALWNNHDDSFWKLDSLRAACSQHLDNVSKELGFRDERLLPIGLWLDGVPVKYDRSESLEVVTMNFPHVGGDLASMRFPLTALYKGHCAKTSTLDAIMHVLAWSLTCLAEGVFPKYGPHGEELKGKRAKLAGRSLHAKGILVEVRGDWAAFKSVFRLPAWSQTDACCYRCQANKTNLSFMDASSTAPWRQLPLTHWELVGRIFAAHGSCSPLFACPGFKTDVFAIDWLHCVDQGVAADYLGSLMHTILKEIPGSPTEKLACLFKHVQDFYRRSNAESRLDNLTAGMIKKQNAASPKLRCKAGEARCLIPWISEACEHFLTGDTAEHRAATDAGKYLQECYSHLSPARFDRNKLAAACRKFLLLYASLATLYSNQSVWRFKPKHHLFLHLCEESLDSPSLHWNYRDEDFGGSLAHIGERRGGANTANVLSHIALQMFYAKHQIPIFGPL